MAIKASGHLARVWMIPPTAFGGIVTLRSLNNATAPALVPAGTGPYDFFMGIDLNGTDGGVNFTNDPIYMPLRFDPETNDISPIGDKVYHPATHPNTFGYEFPDDYREYFSQGVHLNHDNDICAYIIPWASGTSGTGHVVTHPNITTEEVGAPRYGAMTGYKSDFFSATGSVSINKSKNRAIVTYCNFYDTRRVASIYSYNHATGALGHINTSSGGGGIIGNRRLEFIPGSDTISVGSALFDTAIYVYNTGGNSFVRGASLGVSSNAAEYMKFFELEGEAYVLILDLSTIRVFHISAGGTPTNVYNHTVNVDGETLDDSGSTLEPYELSIIPAKHLGPGVFGVLYGLQLQEAREDPTFRDWTPSFQILSFGATGVTVVNSIIIHAPTLMSEFVDINGTQYLEWSYYSPLVIDFETVLFNVNFRMNNVNAQWFPAILVAKAGDIIVPVSFWNNVKSVSHGAS